MKTICEYTQSKNLMGRFNKYTDIITELQRTAKEHGVKAGWVQVMGAVEKATLSYYDQTERKYVNKTFEGDYEIVSCYGNLSMKDDAHFAHIHIVLSDTQYGTVAGHLIPGSSVIFAGEFVIQAFAGEKHNTSLQRHFDDETGLALW